MNSINNEKMIAFHLNVLWQTLACMQWDYNLNTLLEYVSLCFSLLYHTNRYIMLPRVICVLLAVSKKTEGRNILAKVLRIWLLKKLYSYLGNPHW